MPPTLLTILTLAVPSQHASNAAYYPYACSSLPTCLQCPLTLAQSSRWLMILMFLQPPQDETTTPPPISALTTALSSPLLSILTLPRCPQDVPPTPPLTPLMPNPLSTAYHPYAQVLDP
ncbi:hypothetical protein O181_032209 [Austropuccinia psidii MF-1]|uniref:Uncharacterized protein n=1 Tax=Austropuccinia psidii MF-1 TaxID=1389203 RepID=A0A9Q3CWC9_9BASI|nr:hypothetical protein [Austropuccinia psidii MF-1]